MNSKIKLIWRAVFKDDTTINQIENLQERSFVEVKNRFNDLDKFELIHTEKPLRITVDLRRGFIFVNEPNYIMPELNKEKYNIRLICNRRMRKVIQGNNKSEEFVCYILGYQYNDRTGKNCQVILNVDNEGNISIGDL